MSDSTTATSIAPPPSDRIITFENTAGFHLVVYIRPLSRSKRTSVFFRAVHWFEDHRLDGPQQPFCVIPSFEEEPENKPADSPFTGKAYFDGKHCGPLFEPNPQQSYKEREPDDSEITIWPSGARAFLKGKGGVKESKPSPSGLFG